MNSKMEINDLTSFCDVFSSFREKPREFLTNSLKTSTSQNLSNTLLSSRGGSARRLLMNSAEHSHDLRLEETNGHDSYTDQDKSELSLDLGSLNSSLNKSYNKSVSFNNKLHVSRLDDEEGDLQEEFAEELQKLIDREIEDSELTQEDLAGKPVSPKDSAWYTEPLHLTKNTEFPVFEQLGIKEPTVSSMKRSAGMTGTELAQRRVATECSLSEEARLYFPVTLGEVPSVMRTITPSLPPENGINTLRTEEKSKRMSESSYEFPKQQAVSDYNYLKASQPFLDQTVVATPYQYELARLKMERLRLEEQRLLTSKREHELERIRGPEPKWYVTSCAT